MSDLDLIRKVQDLEAKMRWFENGEYATANWKYRDTPLTSTAWDGDDTKTPGTITVNAISTFSVPTGARAVCVFIQGTWAAAAAASWASIRPTGGSYSYGKITAHSTYAQHAQCAVPLDANGAFDVVVNNANMTQSYLWVVGYMM